MRFVDLEAQRHRLGDAVDRALARVVDHQQFIDGPEVGLLEAQLASRIGEGVVTVGCSSGTDAIVLALLALGVRPGDGVVVPTYTFAATAEAVALVGAVPVFVDVEADTFNVSPASLAAALDDPPAGVPLVGIIPVDLFGHPAPHDQIQKLAADAGCWVLVDGAQSYGAAWQGQPTGAWGQVTTTSFFPAKPLGAYGDGGAVFTSDSSLADVMRSLRNHGAGADRYENVRIGMTGRLDTLQAAVLLEKLTIFDDELRARQAVADGYTERLRDVPDLVLPAVADGATSAWAQWTMRTPNRDELADRLRAAGVPTAIYYTVPLHEQPAYAAYPVAAGGTPVAAELCHTVLSLPMHPYLTATDLDVVADAVRGGSAAT